MVSNLYGQFNFHVNSLWLKICTLFSKLLHSQEESFSFSRVNIKFLPPYIIEPNKLNEHHQKIHKGLKYFDDEGKFEV